MDKKALIKAFLVAAAYVIYTTIACLAVESRHPVLIGLTVGPLIAGALIAIVAAFYEYFKD